jgi:hypothetical protein
MEEPGTFIVVIFGPSSFGDLVQGADKSMRRPGSAQQGVDQSALSLALQKSYTNGSRGGSGSGASMLSARYSESPRSGMPWSGASIKAPECTPEQCASHIPYHYAHARPLVRTTPLLVVDTGLERRELRRI